MQRHKFVIVGAGTAGIITATYIKKYWGDSVDVTLVYDHLNPGIGVGESLTPIIFNYLNYVGISRDELIKNVNATIKLGLKFKNWLNDGGHHFHNFHQVMKSPTNVGAAYDIVYNQYDQDTCYGKYHTDNFFVPSTGQETQALHFDATLFSQYVQSKFKDKLNIIDDIVVDVRQDENGISSLVLKKNGELKGDFYVDCSGFKSVLFSKFNVQWVDKTSWMPLDSCIPNPTVWDSKTIPNYTTSEATEEGWSFQIPLVHRWGVGYLFSSKFLDEEQAFVKFEKFVKERFNVPLTNTSRVIKFKSGYWEDTWYKNCLTVGLSAGFTEPLEATNIHQTVYQIERFINVYDLKPCNLDIRSYNAHIKDLIENIYQYIRFCYTTGRTDSEFWKYMTNNTPGVVRDIEEKISRDVCNFISLPGSTFDYTNFTKIAYGLKKINRQTYYDCLVRRKALETGRLESDNIRRLKTNLSKTAVPHSELISKIINGSN